MSAPQLAYLLIGVALLAYVLTGGADFGAGFWHLVARGPRAQAQRNALEHAIAPIWEANHVWLIFLIVAMFTLFPTAFSVMSIALHIPITLALIGIVLRGAAFSFHSYGLQSEPRRTALARVFAGASVMTPMFLGVSLAALSTGAVRVSGSDVTSGFFAGWLTPFAWLVGALAVALFALLAAVYMTVASPATVRADFRRHALGAEVAGAGFAAAAFWRARVDAPALFARLSESQWTWPLQLTTMLFAVATLFALWKRRFQAARVTVAAQVGMVVIGWGAAMNWHFVLPDVSVASAASPAVVFSAFFPAVGAGALLLGPALWYLYRVFRAH
ncbi:MAG: putative Cytochrome bd2, subunit [Myxococcaceae bacterium]|nr:putative Cytochrome bd2, subunit [Myxococcaceae bacterium]